MKLNHMTRERGRAVTAILGVGAAVLALSACGGNDDKVASDGTVTITVVPSHLDSAANAAVLAGVHQGIFKDCKLDVKLKEGGGGGDTIRTITSGAAQFAFPSVASAITAYNAGSSLDIVAGQALGTNGGAMLVLPKSDLSGPQDLSGKKVGISAKGSNNATQLDSVVKQLGLKDVTQVTVGEVPDGMAALAAGAVDATWATEPDVSQLVAQGKAKVLYKVDDYIKDYQLTVTAANSEYVKDHPDVVKNFVDCMDKANKAAEADPDATGKAFADVAKLDSPDAGVAAVKSNLDPNRYSVDVDIPGMNEAISEMVDAGLLDDGTTLSDFKDAFHLPSGGAAAYTGGTP